MAHLCFQKIIQALRTTRNSLCLACHIAGHTRHVDNMCSLELGDRETVRDVVPFHDTFYALSLCNDDAPVILVFENNAGRRRRSGGSGCRREGLEVGLSFDYMLDTFFRGRWGRV